MQRHGVPGTVQVDDLDRRYRRFRVDAQRSDGSVAATAE
jgi:hypothetical protein